MDGRNDKANNRYGLRNRKHSNRDDGLNIDKHGLDNKDEEEEEEYEVNCPHQRRRVGEANNGDPEEQLDVPRVIDFDGDLEQLLNPEGRDEGHEDNNGQRGALCDNQ